MTRHGVAGLAGISERVHSEAGHFSSCASSRRPINPVNSQNMFLVNQLALKKLDSASLARPRAAAPRRGTAHRQGCGNLRISASSFWSLNPAPGCHPQLKPVDLTEIIGSHRLCSLASRDLAESATEAVDFTLLDHGE
jgi:hypothetical protein